MTTPIQHGTTTAYTGHGCRCDECRAANAAYFRAYRAVLAAKNTPDEQIPHGTTNGYSNYRCRCDQCRATMRAARARQRQARQSEAQR